MRLFHGSNVAIERPDVTFNKGFADLGQGFYLTDDRRAAQSRALSRARIGSGGSAVVSTFEFYDDAVSWVVLGGAQTSGSVKDAVFGLRFLTEREGLIAWARYIRECRAGRTAVDGWGDPAVVRAWIATEEVEMICAGFAPAEELAEFIDPAELTVQYCFRNQQLIDQHLTFISAERL